MNINHIFDDNTIILSISNRKILMKSIDPNSSSIDQIPIRISQINHFISYLLYRCSICSPFIKNILWNSYKHKEFEAEKIGIYIFYTDAFLTNNEDLKQRSLANDSIYIACPSERTFTSRVKTFLQYEAHDPLTVYNEHYELFNQIQENFLSLVTQAKVYHQGNAFGQLNLVKMDAFIFKNFPILIDKLAPHLKLITNLGLDQNYLQTINRPQETMLGLFGSESNPDFEKAVLLILNFFKDNNHVYKSPISYADLFQTFINTPYAWNETAILCLITYLIHQRRLEVMYNSLILTPYQVSLNITNEELKPNLYFYIIL